MSLQGPVWIRKRRGKREREKEIERVKATTEMWIRCPLDASHVLQHIQGGRD